jgi:hypothetical protein
MAQSSEYKGIQKKPQINADERRYFPITDFSKIIHRKGRKAAQQESLCPLRSLRLKVFSAPAHERAPQQPALAVHPRLSRAGDEHGGREDGGDRGYAG